MDGPGRHYASEGSQRRTNTIQFLLYEASEIVKGVEGDNGMMVTRE